MSRRRSGPVYDLRIVIRNVDDDERRVREGGLPLLHG
jgi:hypothetical protein